MTTLIIAFSEAVSLDEVKRLTRENETKISNPFCLNYFYQLAKLARRRIRKVEQVNNN